MRVRSHFRIDQSHLQLLVETVRQRSTPVTMVGPRHSPEVSHSFTDLLSSDLSLRVVASVIEEARPDRDGHLFDL